MDLAFAISRRLDTRFSPPVSYALALFYLSVGVLAAVVLASLMQPRVANFRLRPHWAAAIGALVTVLSGLVSLAEAGESLRFLLAPMLTLVSLMAMTLVADRVGLFTSFTHTLARAANGDAKRLFAYLFFGGTVIGALFSNDAAVLILTPLVATLLSEISSDSWSERAKLPYFFAVLYVANLVGLLVISNPINIVVAENFDIGFVRYAQWMVLPALASVACTFVALRYYFRNDLPTHYECPKHFHAPVEGRSFRKITALLIGLTLAGFFTQGITGMPLHIIAIGGSLLLLAAYWRIEGGRLAPIGKGIAWDVVLFVAAIFVVAKGVGNAGLSAHLGGYLAALYQHSEPLSISATGGIAAGLSALMNNHPVAYTMSMSIADMGLAQGPTQSHIFAALIGGDLGPKMLPIGSLAALLWFRLLRDRGVHVSYAEYIKLGVPVTLLAVAAALGVLLLEIAMF